MGLVDREKLLNKRCRVKDLAAVDDEIYVVPQEEIIAAPAEAPAHWFLRGGRWICSHCGARALLKDEGGTHGFSHEYVYSPSPYCPHCGSPMYQEDYHEHH